MLPYLSFHTFSHCLTFLCLFLYGFCQPHLLFVSNISGHLDHVSPTSNMLLFSSSFRLVLFMLSFVLFLFFFLVFKVIYIPQMCLLSWMKGFLAPYGTQIALYCKCKTVVKSSHSVSCID